MTAKRRNRIVWISAGELKIHPTAQRAIVNAQLKKRMADLDLDAIGVLHGVEIAETTEIQVDGAKHTLTPGVYVIDGQHRVISLQRHGFGDWKVQVEIHPEAVDPARASALFLRLNARAIVDAFTMFEQSVRSGDPVAIEAKRIIESHGYRIARASKDGQFGAVSSARRVFDIDNGATLNDAQTVIVESFGLTSGGADGKLLEGIASVLAVNNGSLDRDTLIKKLAKYPGSAPGIIGDAKGLRKIRRGTLVGCIAEVVVETYNQRRRGDQRITLP